MILNVIVQGWKRKTWLNNWIFFFSMLKPNKRREIETESANRQKWQPYRLALMKLKKEINKFIWVRWRITIMLLLLEPLDFWVFSVKIAKNNFFLYCFVTFFCGKCFYLSETLTRFCLLNFQNLIRAFRKIKGVRKKECLSLLTRIFLINERFKCP